MNITQAFDDQPEFNHLLRRLQFPVSKVNRLIDQEGILNCEHSSERYRDFDNKHKSVIWKSNRCCLQDLLFTSERAPAQSTISLF